MKILFKLRNKLVTSTTLRYIYLIIFLVLVFTVLTISGSSINTWENYIDEEGSEHYLGVPRSIRSDEWMVQTSLGLSQKYNYYERINQFVGNGQDTSVIYDAPNNHWSTLFKPHNWGFFILPEENAFAFKWWFRGAILIISTYLLLLLLTKYNYFLSISGSLIIFFTPMVQWWYSIQILEPIAYGFLALYFALRILKFESKPRLFTYFLGFSYSMLPFALALYPPFQIPVLYVVVFVFVGYIIENWNGIKENLKVKILSLFIAFIFSLATLITYYFSVKETIDIFLDTSYPGDRFVNGGNYSLLHFLSGPYSFLLQLNSSSIPAFFGNQSEGASFITIVLFILLLPLILYTTLSSKLKILKSNAVLICIVLLFLIQTFFIFIGFPDFIAKYSLFYLIPENRMIIGIGLLSFIGIIIFISKYLSNEIEIYSSKKLAFIYGIISFALVFIIGRELNLIAPQYIRNIFIILFIACLSGLIIFFLIWNDRIRLGVIALVLFSIFSAGMVNPFNIGLKPLRDSELANELIEFNKQNNPENKKWIVYDSMFYGNYLIAQGIPTLNGSHLYPQLDLWRELDPNGLYDFNYNRYSHIIFEYGEDGEEIIFSNPVADTLKIKINPCNQFFQDKSNVLITETDIPQSECLELVKLRNNLRFYKYI
jgi:hypothetical protein